ncbi:phosphopantetheine-binding protein, partial [Streptomyces sp. NPDC089795]|uniref:phosphopantetheine-binding protein n=1 Tax=Streptomyces sp. NPDC089795 TaxID=3155297 RepID=UPI003431F39C
THDLPAQSLAWGFWEQNSGMTATLGEADRSRISRQGVLPLGSEDGMALFDLAGRAGEAVMLPMRLNFAVRPAVVPPVLRKLVSTGRRSAVGAAGAAAGGGLVRQLEAMPEEDRFDAVLAVVLGEVAAGLGHASAESVGADRSFQELGFDSLIAVELRNRLSEIAGVKLPSTLVFDYPTPRELAGYLTRTLAPQQASASELLFRQIAGIESLLAGISPGEVDLVQARERLRDLFSQHSEAEAADGGAAQSGSLLGSTDDELFKFLDEELDL